MWYLTLNENGLRGTLPDEIALLSAKIQHLDLSGKELEGYIHDNTFDNGGLRTFKMNANPALRADGFPNSWSRQHRGD